ncbi:MAG: putative Ig domain-containing protein [Actinobacteria bacterium]|nr:putative Ig domain-containing protein [Actinomycetota bacterium]
MTRPASCGLGRAKPDRPEYLGVKRLTLILAVVAALAGASGAPAGGIADEPCPNTRGEHTNTCPPGTVGAPYSIRFVESDGSGCGPGRQTFHFDSGLLPPGLTLAPDGSLNGIARQAGSFQFYVEMREPQDDPSNCVGKRTQKQFTLKIRKQPWIISTPAIPRESEVGMPFRLTLRARGGSGLFVWELVAGKLPVGLGLRDDGSIVGTPRIAGTYRFVARARDTEARSLSWPVVLVVAPRLVVRTKQLPAAKVGRFYSAGLTAAGGVAPTVWKLRRGRLPHGIRLAPALGRFTGTPREAGTYLVAVEVTDGLKAKSTGTFAIVIKDAVTVGHARAAGGVDIRAASVPQLHGHVR